MESKKDYEVAALIIRTRLDQAKGMFNRAGAALTVTAIHAIAKDFAEAYAAENPRFDKEKFLAACGM